MIMKLKLTVGMNGKKKEVDVTDWLKPSNQRKELSQKMSYSNEIWHGSSFNDVY